MAKAQKQAVQTATEEAKAAAENALCEVEAAAEITGSPFFKSYVPREQRAWQVEVDEARHRAKCARPDAKRDAKLTEANIKENTKIFCYLLT